jgi:hypothetical protein
MRQGLAAAGARPRHAAGQRQPTAMRLLSGRTAFGMHPCLGCATEHGSAPEPRGRALPHRARLFCRRWSAGRWTLPRVARAWVSGVHPKDLRAAAAAGPGLSSRQPLPSGAPPLPPLAGELLRVNGFIVHHVTLLNPLTRQQLCSRNMETGEVQVGAAGCVWRWAAAARAAAAPTPLVQVGPGSGAHGLQLQAAVALGPGDGSAGQKSLSLRPANWQAPALPDRHRPPTRHTGSM